MDELTKQKIPIIIKQHILQTKIGYLVEKMSLEKRKCKEADGAFSSKPDENHKDMVLIRHTSTDYTKVKNPLPTIDTKIVEADRVLSLGNI
jgi:hypothetical protein